MKFSDFIQPELVLVNMPSTTQEDVLEEFSDALERAGVIRIEERKSFLEHILEREELGTTGIGNGFAVPHDKTPMVDKVWVAIGILQEAIDWRSLGGELVDVIFLFVVPVDQGAEYLRTLEFVCKHLRNTSFCSSLRQAKTVDDVCTLFEEMDWHNSTDA